MLVQIPKKIKELNIYLFDVVNYYPSITPELFNKALDFAATIVDISEEDRRLFIQSKNSLLFHKSKILHKMGTGNFDNTMGSFDGAETCECVGLYILEKIKKLKIENGLYRDDGLGITKSSPRENDILRKKIEKIFKENGLNITVEANKEVINFLDVTLDIRDGSFKPFTKENNVTKYVHIDSNHPPVVL